MPTVDLLIIGGGPAGLSAALFFSRLRRPAMLYDSGTYRNAGVTVSHTILGHEGVNPAQYRVKARKEIEAGYPLTTFVDGAITSLSKQTGMQTHTQAQKQTLFEAKDDMGRTIIARKVVIATGIKDVLPDIPGIYEAWGNRLIHCIFCHGTETAQQPFAFLLTPNKANPMVVASMFKLWRTLEHTTTYILTHGMDPDTPEGLEASGLARFRPFIDANSHKYTIISSRITAMSSTAEGITVSFVDRDPLSVPYMATFPARLEPPSEAAGVLTNLVDLTPMGAIAPAPASLEPLQMSRMGDDPRTQVPGLFWAGNSGSPMANVNLAVQQGQTAAALAAEQLGEEDLQNML